MLASSVKIKTRGEKNKKFVGRRRKVREVPVLSAVAGNEQFFYFFCISVSNFSSFFYAVIAIFFGAASALRGMLMFKTPFLNVA